jgi:hypothetical protein
MRYPKGSLILSEDTDIPALRKAYQGGHATSRQLYRALHPVFDQKQWKNFQRRLQLLSERNFLARFVVAGMNEPVYALGEDGTRSLQGRLPMIIEAGSRNGRAGNRDHLWHNVELFEIHLQLRQTGLVLSWMYEPEIRADNELTSFGYAKDYDAIVTFKCGGKSGKIALEYERSPKSTKQYRRIAELLNNETRIDAVVYLVCNVQMESFLLNGLRSARFPVYICQARALAASPAEALLVDAARSSQHRLIDCLP